MIAANPSIENGQCVDVLFANTNIVSHALARNAQNVTKGAFWHCSTKGNASKISIISGTLNRSAPALVSRRYSPIVDLNALTPTKILPMKSR